jgi:hypothetical protein
MPKTRRAVLLISALLLLGGLQSNVTGRDLLRYYPNDVFLELFSVRGSWAIAILRQPPIIIPDASPLRLGFINIAVRWGTFWRVDLEGNWWGGAIILLIPSLIFEIRARPRRNTGAGFEVKPISRPDGDVNASVVAREDAGP